MKKNTADKTASNQKSAKADKPRTLSIFPSETGSLSQHELGRLAFKANSMAETIIQALTEHGIRAGDERKKVVSDIKAKFDKASDSTIRTQIYRGIVYLRAIPRANFPAISALRIP